VTIQSALEGLTEEFERLRTQQAIVRGRMLENHDELLKSQKVAEERRKSISDLAEQIISEVRKVENQLLAQLEKESNLRERKLIASKKKTNSFSSSVEFYTKIFDAIRTSNPNSEFLKLSFELTEQLKDLSTLKAECMSYKLASDKKHFDMKMPFKKAIDEIVSPVSHQSRFGFDLDPLKFQNFTIMRSLQQDPSQIQKLLDLTSKAPSPMLRLASPNTFSFESSKMNRSLNSSSSLSSSSRTKLCSEADPVRIRMKDLRALFSSNVSKAQSLQLDVTRRKVYPKKMEAERLCNDVESFASINNEVVKILQDVKSRLGLRSQNQSPDNEQDEDIDLTMRKVDDWICECKDLLTKHEQMKHIFKSIKPYILSVTKQKEKSNTRLTPVVPLDHLDDLKRSVVVNDSVQEQRIQAIEAMYKSQSLERAAVNSSEIQKELQLTKQKLKRAKCNPPSSSIQLGTALESNCGSFNVSNVESVMSSQDEQDFSIDPEQASTSATWTSGSSISPPSAEE